MVESNMKLSKKSDGWWVTNIPECEPCGPYSTKEDAEETRRGLKRTFDNWDKRSFFTCDNQ